VQALPEQPGLTVDSITPIERLVGYPTVGWLAACLSLVTIYLGSKLRSVETKATIDPEPVVAVEMV